MKKKSFKKVSTALSVVILILLTFFGCATPDSSSGGDESPVPEIKTIFWEDDGNGFVQFYTNDSQYYNNAFYAWDTDLSETPMIEGELEVKKMSGYSYGSFGGVFCLTDENNFYLLLIDTEGYYYIGKRVAGTYSDIKTWTTSANLNTGYNVINTLRVTFDGTDTFNVYFNGNVTPETSFTDTSHNGGCYGIWTAVGSSFDENFPYTPVDARFKIVKPTS